VETTATDHIITGTAALLRLLLRPARS
jgi:hypothetical protein